MLHPNHLYSAPLTSSQKIIQLVNGWIEEEKANNSLAAKVISIVFFIFALLFIGSKSILLGAFVLLITIFVFLKNIVSTTLVPLEDFEKVKIQELINVYQRRINLSFYYIGIGFVLMIIYFLEKYTILINFNILPVNSLDQSTEAILVLSFLAGGIYQIIKHRKRIITVKEELLNIID